MRRHVLIALAALAASVGAVSPSAAQNSLKVGQLRCEVSAGLGLIVMSTKEMRCAFTSAQGVKEYYYGRIQKFGLDIGVTNKGILAWTVFSATNGTQRGALAGEYVGVDASATVAAGVGANYLVGGSSRAITLQPWSVQAQSGLALAGGVAALTLRPAE
jgi:hypothetical protein